MAHGTYLRSDINIKEKKNTNSGTTLINNRTRGILGYLFFFFLTKA